MCPCPLDHKSTSPLPAPFLNTNPKCLTFRPADTHPPNWRQLPSSHTKSSMSIPVIPRQPTGTLSIASQTSQPPSARTSTCLSPAALSLATPSTRHLESSSTPTSTLHRHRSGSSQVPDRLPHLPTSDSVASSQRPPTRHRRHSRVSLSATSK